MQTLFALLVLCLALTDGFISHGASSWRIGSSRLWAAEQTPAIPPRKALFFEIVESGLKDRFEPSDIERVFKFCSYAKGELAMPFIDKSSQHEPCEEYIEGLTARPWWSTSASAEFNKWVPALQEAAGIIRSELDNVLAQDELSTFKADSNYQQTMGAGWTAFRLQRLGEWNQPNTERFPLTTRLLQSLDIPLAVRGVMFAKQNPNSGVQPHSDGRNFILTAHLGLTVPEGCSITCAGEKREWKEGEVVIFDTSYTHSTENRNADKARFVLIVDFWHPDLSQTERDALAWIYDARNKFESGRAKDIDCSWVKQGKPLTTQAYTDSLRGFGDKVVAFFSDGGLIKYR